MLWASIVSYNLETAQRIRDGKPDQALPRLEHYALFFNKALQMHPDPNPQFRAEVDSIFHPEVWEAGPLAEKLTKVQNKAEKYTASYPDSLRSLDEWPR